MQKLEYKINIAAPAKKVWDTMLAHGTYEQWVAAGWPATTYDGKWQTGSFIKFFGEDKSGTMVEITALDQYKNIYAKHVAILLKDGTEDKDSDLAKGWIGSVENYSFAEQNGATVLTVEIETNSQWVKMFNDGWPNALSKLKEICEG